ncbi:MAG TPA: molybdopterin-dependent oxidoreductase [Steroidobacteraceae bacterium]
MPTRKSFCRFCHANCAIEVEIVDGRAVEVRGDVSDPLFGGYTCMKGRELPAQTYHPQRLRSSLKRAPAGGFAPLGSEQALDEIAARLDAIRAQHGPRAIATYCGTYGFMNSAALPVAAGFHAGIGSPNLYTSITIDQPAKVYLWSRVGAWMGGPQAFSQSDVSMMIGNNPLTSHYAWQGSVPPFSPSRRLRDAKARGLKLICIDPRRTMVAQLADIHLQVRPGEDAPLLAAMLRVILAEGLHDQEFCAAHVEGLHELRASVEGFTPEYAARRADVPAAALTAAARLFARARRGTATTGTGAEMSRNGALTEHLVMALNIVCGRFCREGEVAPFPRVLSAAVPRKAQVLAPKPLWGEGCTPSRIRGLTQMAGFEMPAATAADEILTPGEGQVRALICIGGNPLVAWPNQQKVERALKSLDLLVCIDIKQSQTAQLADYIIAPQVCLERDDIATAPEVFYEEPYARYAEALLAPQGDVIDEWEFFWGLARRMGTAIPTAGGPLPMDVKPSKFEVLEKITHGCRVPLARVRDETRDGGRIFTEVKLRVAPADAGADARLQLAPALVPEQLVALRAEPVDAAGRASQGDWPGTHLLICRRTRQYFNSTGQDLGALRAKGITNHAHLHPADLQRLGAQEDDLLEISTAHAHILGVAKPAADLKPGVVSMAHAFGARGADASAVRAHGASTNRLVDDEVDYDPITGACRQSAIAVRIRVLPRAARAHSE